MSTDGGNDPVRDRDGSGSDCPDELTLSSYLEGRLEQAEAERLEAHMSQCPTCAQAVRELRELLSDASEEDIPDEILEQVKQRAKNLVEK